MTSLPKWALGALAFVALSLGFAAPAQAYGGHRGGVSVSFGDPYSGVYLSVPIGHRYHHRRHYNHYPYYHSGYGYYPYAYQYPSHYRYRHDYRHRPYAWRHHYGWRDDGWRHHRKHRRHHRRHH